GSAEDRDGVAGDHVGTRRAPAPLARGGVNSEDVGAQVVILAEDDGVAVDDRRATGAPVHEVGRPGQWQAPDLLAIRRVKGEQANGAGVDEDALAVGSWRR